MISKLVVITLLLSLLSICVSFNFRSSRHIFHINPSVASSSSRLHKSYDLEHLSRGNARFPALSDDPKGLFDVAFNAIPLAVLIVVAATERENRKEIFAAQDKAIGVWKATQEEAIAAEKESRKEASLLQEKAITAERESRKEDIAAEREDLKAALLHQNEIWSLRFDNHSARREKIKEYNGLPPPQSDLKSESPDST